VLTEWFETLGGGSIVMTWRDPTAAGRQGLAVLGLPPRTLTEIDGLILVKSPHPQDNELNAPSPPL
jgi:CRISPR-associated protein Cas2